MSKKKVIKGRSGRLVVRQSIVPVETEESEPTSRLRADCKQPSAPRQRHRGRGIHLDVDRSDD